MCHITPLPPHNGHLSTMATFLSPQGDQGGEVPNCNNIISTKLHHWIIHVSKAMSQIVGNISSPQALKHVVKLGW